MIRHVFPRVVPLAILLAAACATKSGGGGGESDTSIQASIAATEDVEFIDIKVTRLDNGAVVYYSGQQPAENHFAGRRDLMRNVILEADTDFLFDATAYDSAHGSAIHALTVQKRTQPAGIHTEVVIVIDLNEGAQSDGGPTSETDITAITDNIPVMFPPVLSDIPYNGTPVTISYMGLDVDFGDAPGQDPYETMTFFTTVLAGDLTGGGTTFNLGPTFSFTATSDADIELLCGVIDHWGRIAYVLMLIQPSTGAFQMVAQGEGYGVMPDTGTLPPQQPKRAGKRAGTTEEGPPPADGPMGLAVLKRNDTTPHSILAITNTADHARATPDDLAWWREGTIKSFNLYTNNGVPNPVVNKLRVEITPPSRGTALIDTLKFIPGDLFSYGPQVQETPVQLLEPSLAGTLTGNPGGTLEFDGADLDGLSMAYLTDGDGDIIGVASSVTGSGTHGSAVLPTGIPGGAYDFHVFTYGRLTNHAPITIEAPMPPAKKLWLVQPIDLNQALGIINAVNDNGVAAGTQQIAGGQQAAIWMNGTQTLLALPAGSDSAAGGINAAGTVVGGLTDRSSFLSSPVAWHGGVQPTILALPSGHTDGVVTGINASDVAVGTVRPSTDSAGRPRGAVWNGTLSSTVPTLLADSGPFGTEAAAVNDTGEIAGIVYDNQAKTMLHAVRWGGAGSAPAALETPAGLNSRATAINSGGDVVGYTFDVGAGNSHAVVWRGTGRTTLPDPLLQTLQAQAYGINNEGIVVGVATDGFNVFAVVWVPDGGGYLAYAIELGNALAISNNNVIGGYRSFTGATLWAPTASDLELAPAAANVQQDVSFLAAWTRNFVGGINDAGTIAGTYNDNGYNHAYFEKGGVFTVLDNGTMEESSYSKAINAAGNVAGLLQGSDQHQHAVVWFAAGGKTFLEHPAGSQNTAQAEDLNDSNQAVGWYFAADATMHPAYWNGATGTMTELGRPDHIQSSAANGINNLGVAVGYALHDTIALGQVNAYPLRWDSAGAAPTILEGSGFVYKINDAGVAVGGSFAMDTVRATSSAAAAWIGTTRIELPQPAPYLINVLANDIDDNNNIVGEAYAYDGRVFAVLWTPTSANTWAVARLAPIDGNPGARAVAMSPNGNIVGEIVNGRATRWLAAP